MKSTFRILFYLRGNHLNKKTGLSSIMIRITLDGSLKQFCSKLEIDRRLWDVVNGKAKGRSLKALEVNSYLDDIRGALQRCYRICVKNTGKCPWSSLKALS